MHYENYLLGQGKSSNGDPLMACSLVLSIDPKGVPMLGFYEGLHPHANGGSVPIEELGANWHVGLKAFKKSNTEWIVPLVQSWCNGGEFDLAELIELYHEIHGREPDFTSGMLHQFPSVARWRE